MKSVATLASLALLGLTGACSAPSDAAPEIGDAAVAQVGSESGESASVATAAKPGPAFANPVLPDLLDMSDEPAPPIPDGCESQESLNFDPDRCGSEPEFRVEPLAGNWRIERVTQDRPDGPKVTEDDPGVIGSVFRIDATEARFIKVASDRLRTDTCRQPEFGEIGESASRAQGGTLYAAAQRWEIDDPGGVHKFGCYQGGSWALSSDRMSDHEGALVIGTKLMVMRWHDNQILLARRYSR